MDQIVRDIYQRVKRKVFDLSVLMKINVTGL